MIPICLISALTVVSAQGPGTRPQTGGPPDLQGTYDVATLTPLERPAGQPLEMSDEQARRAAQQVIDLVALANRPSSPTRAAPPLGGDGSQGNSGNVGGYNVYWIGGLPSRVTVLDGRPRSSLIIDPADGRLPPTTRPAVPASAVPPQTPGVEPPDAADGPESRSLAERCLLVGSTSSTPILPFLYNNVHQIIQTPDYVVIHNEMVHDARIIRIGGRHRPSAMRTWLGDSVGRWEGDTLVVDTINFRPQNGFLGASENLHVVERFSRVDARTLRYQFTIEDPRTWARPWTAEYAWPATDERIFEYACHENNYALGTILRGARLLEAERAGSAPRP